MEFLDHLATGISAAGSPQNLLFCLAGVFLGTVIGVLPGIGPLAAIAILLPITFSLSPLPALIMLAGIYYGTQYGGSTTAILIAMPGESSSVVTCLDGHQMARRGRAGAALAIAALGSFFAGCVGTLFIAAFAIPLAAFAQQFRSPEYFSLMVLGLVMAVVLAHGSVLKAVAMVLIGLLFGLVGADLYSGVARFTLGFSGLWDGIDLLPLVLGLFGIVEILRNLETSSVQRPPLGMKFSELWPSSEEFKRAIPAALRGTGLGTLLGILPGGGAILASFASYTLEKKISKTPQEFGSGAVEGVAGPEAANNAASQTSFIPLLSLGIPSNPIMAIMMGALVIQGIQPGSAVINTNPDLFWGLIVSMWIGNCMLLVLNLPLVGIWVRLLSVPYRLLYPTILLFCAVGVFSTSTEPFMMALMIASAIFGYVLLKLGCEPAPLILGFILGPLMEENLRRSLILSSGDPLIFFERPIAASFLFASILLLAVIVVPQIRKSRATAFQDE